MNAHIKIYYGRAAEIDTLSSQGRCGSLVLNLAPRPSKQQMVAFQYLGSDSKTISEGSQISQDFFPFLPLGLPYLKGFTSLKLRSQYRELWKKKRSYVKR